MEKYNTLEESNEALASLCEIIKTEKCSKVREEVRRDQVSFLIFLAGVLPEHRHKLIRERMDAIANAAEEMQASGLHAGVAQYQGVLAGVDLGLTLAEH